MILINYSNIIIILRLPRPQLGVLLNGNHDRYISERDVNVISYPICITIVLRYFVKIK